MVPFTVSRLSVEKLTFIVNILPVFTVSFLKTVTDEPLIDWATPENITRALLFV
jgi:hypothetical protein